MVLVIALAVSSCIRKAHADEMANDLITSTSMLDIVLRHDKACHVIGNGWMAAEVRTRATGEVKDACYKAFGPSYYVVMHADKSYAAISKYMFSPLLHISDTGYAR